MSGPNKYGRCHHNRNALPENEIATHSNPSKKAHIPKELEDEAKRRNLLRQKDWFTTYKLSYNRRSTPYERTRIGKRRKLKQDDLARIAVQCKVPTNKSNLNFSVTNGIFKPSQVSVRLGSQIHGTKRTILSGSKVKVEVTSAGGMATKGLGDPLTTSTRSIRVLKETPIPSITSFEALEEIPTPLQHVSYPGAKEFKIERWISESALKRKRIDSSCMGEMPSDGSMSNSPQSLDGEAGSSETVFEQRRKILYGDISHQKRRSTGYRRNSESHGSTQLPVKLTSTHDKSGVDPMEQIIPKDRQAKSKMQETYDSVITETGNTQTKEGSTTSIPTESKVIGAGAVASLESQSALSWSLSDPGLMSSPDKVHVHLDSEKHETTAFDKHSDNHHQLKKLPSFHTLTASSYTGSSTKGTVGNDVTGDHVLENSSVGSSGAPQTLSQRQNDEWFKWIVSLHRKPAEDEKSNSIESSRQQTSVTPVAQAIQLTGSTPISFRSTFVDIGSTPSIRLHSENPHYPSETDLRSLSDHSHVEFSVTEDSNSSVQPHILGQKFETPINQQSLDIPQPETPAKPLAQRKSISREGNNHGPKPIDLREKFLQVASLPVNIQPKQNKKRNPTDDKAGVLLTACYNSTKNDKAGILLTACYNSTKNDKTACVIMQDDSIPLSKSVSRSIVFVKPQRFEDISPGKRMKIGQTMLIQLETGTELSFVANESTGDFERDEIED